MSLVFALLLVATLRGRVAMLAAAAPAQAQRGPVDGHASIGRPIYDSFAVVRGHPGVVDLRHAVRSAPGPAQRVLLVHGGAAPWSLTGTLQRVLRAHGDRTPCVEVLPAHGERSAYHRAAIIGASSLWTAAHAVTA